MKLSATVFFLFVMMISSTFLLSGSIARGQATDSYNENVEALQEQMMNNQAIMSLIYSMKQDPAFQKVLKDPEIMDAINKGDLSRLSTNPKFLKLLEDSRVQEINKELSK
jgi:hypothetical protein